MSVYFVPLWILFFFLTTVIHRMSFHVDVSTAANYLKYGTHTNEDAKADVTLHCAGKDFMVIRYNEGTYIIEQSINKYNWKILSANETSVYLKNNIYKQFLSNLLSGTSYWYRFHRITKSGLSQAEISNCFTTYEVNYKPKKIPYMYVKKMEVSKNNLSQLQTEIGFIPAEDRCCMYYVVLYRGQHDISLYELQQKMYEFEFNLTSLDFDRNIVVYISSKNGNRQSDNTSLTFNTPSCLDVHHNLTICAPRNVEGLSARVVYENDPFYDVIIKWNKPIEQPDSYTIYINSILNIDGFERYEEVFNVTIPGNITEVTLKNITLGNQYEVIIYATSLGGTSPMTFIRKDNSPLTAHTFYWNIAILLPISILLAIFAGICIYYYKRKRRKYMHYKNCKRLSQKDIGMNTIYNKTAKNKDFSLFEKNILPADKFQLCSKRLQMKNILGSGAYGVVRLGSLHNEFNIPVDVAIKTLKNNPTMDEINNFYQEILTIRSVGKHPNVVSLIGYCVVHDTPFLVVEYCCKGDLRTYLRKIWTYKMNETFDQIAHNNAALIGHNYENHNLESFAKESNIHYQNTCTVTNRLYDVEEDVDNITPADLLNFARQIATGMKFLSANRIVHRDLAARNILVCSDKVVKISDFGLSRDVYQENVYKKQSDGKLPLKWMSLEALTHQIYTTYSDVWSFGVLLWEIISLGGVPYPDISPNNLVKRLKSGYRMERPLNCGMELYNIMYACWHARPQSRPTFTELENKLDKLLCSYTDNKYLNLIKTLEE